MLINGCSHASLHLRSPFYASTLCETLLHAARFRVAILKNMNTKDQLQSYFIRISTQAVINLNLHAEHHACTKVNPGQSLRY